jgi:hypothetical protein
MAGSVLKGALISFLPDGALGIPSLPNVIIFQINPDTITHAWTEPSAAPAPAAASGKTAQADPLAVSGVPGESFSFTLFLDANQEIADTSQNPVAAALATVSGVYTRLAALEMLQYPTGSVTAGLLGQISAGVSASGLGMSAAAASSQSVPASQVPVVLFVWGPQRIVPVRVTAFSTTEKRYDSLLNPVQAEVQITLRVLTPDELAAAQGPMAPVARLAYTYTQGLRQVQAAANLVDSAASIIGMLPTPF